MKKWLTVFVISLLFVSYQNFTPSAPQLNLSNSNVPSCFALGKLDSFKICEKPSGSTNNRCVSHQAFIDKLTDKEDYTWHNWASCLRELKYLRNQSARTLAENPGSRYHADLAAETDSVFNRQILYLLTKENVRFSKTSSQQTKAPKNQTYHGLIKTNGQILTNEFNRIIYTNSLGVAYNSMNQADLAGILLDAAAVETGNKREYYAHLGQSALGVILDPVARGGLSETSACGPQKKLLCTFFYSQTKLNAKNVQGGATLNQFLHALRDFNQMSANLKNINPKLSSALENYIEQGLNQLLDMNSSNAVSFKSYLPPALADSKTPSWIYYGYSPVKNRGYFLDEDKNRNKNCSYHTHVMDLLYLILKDRNDHYLSEFKRNRSSLNGQSILSLLYGPVRAKFALQSAENMDPLLFDSSNNYLSSYKLAWFRDEMVSSSKSRNFTACKTSIDGLLDRRVIRWFDQNTRN